MSSFIHNYQRVLRWLTLDRKTLAIIVFSISSVTLTSSHLHIETVLSAAVLHLIISLSILPVRLAWTYPRYIVVLMAQAKIYWNRENFHMVEKIFRKSVEVCNEDDTWKLNVAHVLFMQNKYKEAIGFYEPIVKKHYDNVSVSEYLIIRILV